MSDGHKNHVEFSMMSRGSKYPNISSGHIDSVQSVLTDTQPPITLEAVNRVLEVGRILRVVLTPEELNALPDVLSAERRGQNTFFQRK